MVDFSGNKIRNVLGIEHPHLEQLNLNHNDIPSLEGLEPKDLPNLISLQLRSNQLSSTGAFLREKVKKSEKYSEKRERKISNLEQCAETAWVALP